MENNVNVNEEILKLKRVNNRNNGIIIGLLVILLFVCIIAVYIKFLG